jgi:hypothetical protein
MMKTLSLYAPIHSLRHVSTALAIMALLSVSHPILAQELDVKAYPGTFCQQNDPDVAVVMYDERGAILVVEIGTGSVRVICPVVRDETVGTAGIRRAFVRYVKGVEGGGVAAFSCTLHSRNHFGGAVASDSKTDTGSRGNKIFSFGAIRSSDQAFPGYYHFVCDIPQVRVLEDGSLTPPSGIISYRVDEIRTSQAQAEELSLDED